MSKSKFEIGDIVKILGHKVKYKVTDIQPFGATYTIYFNNYEYSALEYYCELVYRTPSREEVEKLRSRIVELETIIADREHNEAMDEMWHARYHGE